MIQKLLQTQIKWTLLIPQGRTQVITAAEGSRGRWGVKSKKEIRSDMKKWSKGGAAVRELLRRSRWNWICSVLARIWTALNGGLLFAELQICRRLRGYCALRGLSYGATAREGFISCSTFTGKRNGCGLLRRWLIGKLVILRHAT